MNPAKKILFYVGFPLRLILFAFAWVFLALIGDDTSTKYLREVFHI